MLKAELMELCTRLAPVPEYKLDKLATHHGISILRTPPYHPELQPIEICWAVVKNYMAEHCDFTMSGLRNNLPNAFAKVTSETCKEAMTKVITQEDNRCPRSVVSFCFVLQEKYTIWISDTHLYGVNVRYHVYS